MAFSWSENKGSHRPPPVGMSSCRQRYAWVCKSDTTGAASNRAAPMGRGRGGGARRSDTRAAWPDLVWAPVGGRALTWALKNRHQAAETVRSGKLCEVVSARFAGISTTPECPSPFFGTKRSLVQIQSARLRKWHRKEHLRFFVGRTSARIHSLRAFSMGFPGPIRLTPTHTVVAHASRRSIIPGFDFPEDSHAAGSQPPLVRPRPPAAASPETPGGTAVGGVGPRGCRWGGPPLPPPPRLWW